MRRYLPLSVVIILGGASLFFWRTAFYINQSDSLPYKFFLILKDIAPQRGDFVSIQGHNPSFVLVPLTYLKQVVGLPGDHLEVKGDRLWVKGTVNVFLRSQTKTGRPLTPLKISTIPQGYVFVVGHAWDSFDSRYQEFGLVRRDTIQGKALGFWKKDPTS